MNVGETIVIVDTYQGDEGTRLAFTRLSPSDTEKELKLQHKVAYHHAQSPKKYGITCPRCGKTMVDVHVVSTSDGFFGIERDTFVCIDTACGIRREHTLDGYGL